MNLLSIHVTAKLVPITVKRLIHHSVCIFSRKFCSFCLVLAHCLYEHRITISGASDISKCCFLMSVIQISWFPTHSIHRTVVSEENNKSKPMFLEYTVVVTCLYCRYSNVEVQSQSWPESNYQGKWKEQDKKRKTK